MGLLVQGDMATPVICDLGTKEQIEEFLTPAIRGEKIAALGVSEPNAGSDVAGIQTVAKKDGDDYVINGVEDVHHERHARRLRHAAREDEPRGGRARLQLLPRADEDEGLRRLEEAEEDRQPLERHRRAPLRGHAHPEALPPRRREHGVHVPDAELPDASGSSRATSACAGVGIAIEEAIAYGRERKAFGKPIIKREYWQHKFVDLLTKLEAGKALAYKAVEEYNDERYVKKGPISFETVKIISHGEDLRRRRRSARSPISACSSTAAPGYIEEYHIARAWRDQRLFRIGGGTTETMRYYVAKLLGM